MSVGIGGDDDKVWVGGKTFVERRIEADSPEDLSAEATGDRFTSPTISASGWVWWASAWDSPMLPRPAIRTRVI